MTVIVWDGKKMAADKRMANDYSKAAITTKIIRLPDGGLIGCAGGVAFCEGFRQWMIAGEDPEQFDVQWGEKEGFEVHGLRVLPDGTAWHYDGYHIPIRIENKTYAIGSGASYAEAALFLGCDAQRAVEVACALDPGCGNGIDVLSLEE